MTPSQYECTKCNARLDTAASLCEDCRGELSGNEPSFPRLTAYNGYPESAFDLMSHEDQLCFGQLSHIEQSAFAIALLTDISKTLMNSAPQASHTQAMQDYLSVYFSERY
jgi:hypothetical protein